MQPIECKMGRLMKFSTGADIVPQSVCLHRVLLWDPQGRVLITRPSLYDLDISVCQPPESDLRFVLIM